MSDSRSPGSAPRRTPTVAPVTTTGTVVAIAAIASMLAGCTASVGPQVSGTSSPTTMASTTAATASPPATAPSTSATSTAPVAKTTPVPQKTVVVDPAKLPTGPAPQIPYYVNQTDVLCENGGGSSSTGHLYPADGGKPIPIHLGPADSVTALAQVGSGYLVMISSCFSTTDIRHYTANGRVQDLTGRRQNWTAGFARGADGSLAVSLKAGQVTIFDAAGKSVHTWTLPGIVHQTTPAVVFPDDSVLVLGARAKYRWRLFPDGAVTVPTTPDQMMGVNPGVFSNQGRYFLNPVTFDQSRPVSCSSRLGGMKVIYAQSSQPRWIDCGYYPGPFSPDGTLLAARYLASRKGLLAFIDAMTGDVRVTFQATTRGSVSPAYLETWEDSTHLLVETIGQKSGQISVLRYGLDGSVQKVPLPGAFNYLLY